MYPLGRRKRDATLGESFGMHFTGMMGIQICHIMLGTPTWVIYVCVGIGVNTTHNVLLHIIGVTHARGISSVSEIMEQRTRLNSPSSLFLSVLFVTLIDDD